MAGKAWCCGETTGSSGPGGGPTTVVVQDTPTVDLEGDGSTGNPITAVVIPDPAGPVRTGPNGVDVCVSVNAENVLHKDATGCLEVLAGDGVNPGPGGELDLCLSADAGNTATFGTDGCLFVPPGSGGGGLTTVTTADSPTIDFSGDGTVANPITGVVRISTDAGNTLTTGTDGALYVPPGSGGGLTTVSTQDTPTVNLEGDGTVGNPITATVVPDPAGPVRVGPAGVTVCISADAGNSISLGTDGCLFAPPATGGTTTLADSTCISVTGTGTAGDPYLFAPVISPEPNGLECGPTGLSVSPSADAGNTITIGSDGRLFASPGGGPTPVLIPETVEFPTSGTFDPAAYPGLQYVKVRVQGAGGGGVGVEAQIETGMGAQQGQAGNAGGYAESVIPVSALTGPIPVTVGVGGAGSVTGAAVSGGDSSFGSLVIGEGGLGGGGTPITYGDFKVTATPLLAPASGIGDLVIPGGRARPGFLAIEPTGLPAGGVKGVAIGSQGGRAHLSGDAFPSDWFFSTTGGLGPGGNGNVSIPTTGSNYGGGGSGALSVSSPGFIAARSGGNGAPGIVIVEVYRSV